MQDGDRSQRSPGRVRRRSWLEWLAQPWRSPAVAIALVGSLSLPALLLSSGAMFRESASDRIARRSVDELRPGPAGLDVSAVGSLSAQLGDFDAGVDARLAAVPGLADPVRTLITDPVTIAEEGGETPRRDEARVLARPGAAGAVEIVAGVRAGGVLVPRSLAEERGIEPGDRIVLGSADPVPVAGLYRDLWDGGRHPYWDALSPDDMPEFQRFFNAPSFELVIAEDADLVRLALPGRARWSSPLTEPPRTWTDLRALDAEYRRLELALARDEGLATSYAAFARDPTAPPSTFTALHPVVDRAGRLIADLEPPVRTATAGGVVVGLVVSTLGAVFLLRRRRNDFRLMAADGDSAVAFLGRAIAQYALPAIVGAAIGVGAGWLLIRALGPSGDASLDAVSWRWVVATGFLAVVAAGVVTAALAVRLTDSLDERVGSIGWTWFLLLLGAVVAMWVQVGRAQGRGVDPLVVAFPLVGILAGVAGTIAFLRVVLGSLRRTGRRLPTPLFLAWRSLTASEGGAMALTGAVGLAAGLVVLSSSFVVSIDRATAAKAATVVGAESRVDTLDAIDAADLPADSTLVRTTTTKVGDVTVDVVAIDPETFASAVEWPDEFGRSAAEVVDALGPRAGDGIPAIVVEGWPVPASGEFGLLRRFAYDVVGTVRSAPLASDAHATLIVRADVLEDWARARWDAALQVQDPIEAQIAETLGETAEYESPLEAFGDTALSSQRPEVLAGLAESSQWRRVRVSSLLDESRNLDAESTRWAFDFLGILAVIGGFVALAAMTFYLAERRRQREVAAVMTEQMGITRGTNIVAAIVEMVGLVAIAVAAGTVTALVTARRVFPVFEPRAEVPPRVPLAVEPTPIGIAAIAAVGAVAITAAWTQRAAGRAEKAEVLRG